MKLKRLFLAMTQAERDSVCATIIEAGISSTVGSIPFRDFIKTRMLQAHGYPRQYLLLFRRLDGGAQKRFYDAMLSYDDTTDSPLLTE